MSQKKSKSRKTNGMSKTASKTARAARKPRTMTLAVVEPRLRASKPRNRVTIKASPDRTANESVEVSESRPARNPSAYDIKAQPYAIMLSWSPWSVMLRQHAFAVHAFSNMMRAQQQLAQILRSSIPSVRTTS